MSPEEGLAVIHVDKVCRVGSNDILGGGARRGTMCKRCWEGESEACLGKSESFGVAQMQVWVLLD